MTNSCLSIVARVGARVLGSRWGTGSPGKPDLVHALMLLLSCVVIGVAGCSRSEKAPVAWQDQVQAAFERKDAYSAIAILKPVLVQQPDNAQARFQLGVAYNLVRDQKSAEKELRRAIQLGFIDDGRPSLELARAMLADSRFQELADEVLANPRSEYPPSTVASLLSVRGRALLALGRTAEAEELGRTADLADKENPDLLLLRALLAAKTGDDKKSLSLTSDLLARHQQHVEGMFLQSELLRIRGDYQASMDLYVRILALEPYNLTVHLAKTSLSLVMDKVDDAQKQVDLVGQFVRNNVLVRYTQGLLLLRYGRYRDSLEPFVDARRLDWNFPLPPLALAVTHYGIGDYLLANKMVRQYDAANPGDPLAQSLLAATSRKIEANDARAPASDDEYLKTLGGCIGGIAARFPYYRSPEFASALAPLEEANKNRRPCGHELIDNR